MDLKSETEIYTNSPEKRLVAILKKSQLKSIFQHAGLLVALMVYTILGALIFRRFEYPAELTKFSTVNSSISILRTALFQNLPAEATDEWNDRLLEYETILNEACQTGFPILREDQSQSVEIIQKWTMAKAIFFSSTVLTTIGYGNIVPTTTSGRAFCVIFALVGIPLTLSVIADLGWLLASSFSNMKIPNFLRFATAARRTSSYALTAVCFLFVYLSAGAGIFMLWEEDWTFFDGFYFCFITMTTIGFGDLVPKKPTYMLLCTLYILVGLALTSTIIELVRRQYAQSWKQLQALSGPLADNLRKMAENAPGLDIVAFQQDLRKVLTVMTMSRKSDSGIRFQQGTKNEDWEQAVEAVIRDITVGTNKQPVFQIVIYESSV